MNPQLLNTEFTVVDEIKVNHKMTLEYPDMKGLPDGKLLVLAPPCAGEFDLTDLSAMATTPSGAEVPLAFDKMIVNKGGNIGLFVAGIFVKTVPKDSKVRFSAVSKDTVNDDAKYIAQVKLNIPEADVILPRLEKEGIRFEIDTDVSTPHNAKGFSQNNRITLFIHVDDVPAWEKVSEEYFPV